LNNNRRVQSDRRTRRPISKTEVIGYFRMALSQCSIKVTHRYSLISLCTFRLIRYLSRCRLEYAAADSRETKTIDRRRARNKASDESSKSPVAEIRDYVAMSRSVALDDIRVIEKQEYYDGFTMVFTHATSRSFVTRIDRTYISRSRMSLRSDSRVAKATSYLAR